MRVPLPTTCEIDITTNLGSDKANINTDLETKLFEPQQEPSAKHGEQRVSRRCHWTWDGGAHKGFNKSTRPHKEDSVGGGQKAKGRTRADPVVLARTPKVNTGR